jgi:glutamate/tyrosine decarboxylase-like PLP-dependent enzyme
MIPDALRKVLDRDIGSGAVPFMINATAGTTVLGAFDPIDAIADVAEEYGVWLHVDGALGGSALLSERHSWLLEGRERADSLTWDAHKMLGVPVLCSVILTKRPGMLEKHFTQDASYLFQTDREYAHGNMSMQCGRRNDAFKLWAMWKRRGDSGLAARVDRVFDLARYSTDIVRSDPRMTLTKEPQSVNVCFEVDDRSSEAICDALREEEQYLVGYGIVDQRRVIRLACVNPATTEADLDTFFQTVLRVAENLPPVDNACDRETDLHGAEYVDIGADGGCSSCS